MPREIEGERLLERAEPGEVVLLPVLLELLDGLVGVLHVGGVVLLVMELEELS